MDDKDAYLEGEKYIEQEIKEEGDDCLTTFFSEKDLLASIDNDTVVIGYFIRQETIYLYIFDLYKEKIRIISSPQALDVAYLEIKNLLQKFHQSTKKFFSPFSSLEDIRLKEEFEKLADEQDIYLSDIYCKLSIKEALEKIKMSGRELYKTSLLISPEGALHRIPFSALYDPKEHQYLYEKIRDIHTTISLRILAVQRSIPSHKELKCVFFGVPGNFQLNEEGLFKVDKLLVCIKEEIQAIKDFLGNDNVICFGYGGPKHYQARVETVIEYHNIGTIFYFSGHGGDIEESQDSGPRFLDKIIPWSEMVENNRWNFTNQVIVILSSCLLGRQLENGKEMLGMISALYSKGAASVVSALWEVDDKATSILMPLFVKHLKENLKNGVEHPRTLALKSAMNELRSLDNGKWDVPYFFAPFFVSGAP